METKWKIPGCLWSGYCRADRHRQNEIGWERQSTVQKGKSVDLLYQNDFLMSYHLEICFRCVTSSLQWLQTSRGQWSWRSWGRETSLRLSSRWVVNENIVHTILKHILTILVFEKKKSSVAVFRISPILSTSYVRTVQLPARVISLMWTSCVICIRWIIQNEILIFSQFFSLFGKHLYTIFQEIRAMLS